MIYLPTIIQQVVDKLNATLDDTSKVHYEFGRLLTITNQLTLREKNNLPAFPLIALLLENKIIGNNVKCSIILALKTNENIHNASIISLYSGADFLKTSTGKEYPGASLEAAYVMSKAIKSYYKKTGNKVGIKISGGVSTVGDAVKYYTIVKEVLGEEWCNKDLFRIGASRLAKTLLEEITK